MISLPLCLSAMPALSLPMCLWSLLIGQGSASGFLHLPLHHPLGISHSPLHILAHAASGLLLQFIRASLQTAL